MSPGGVKDTALSVLAHPGPRLGAFVVATFGEHQTIRAVLSVNVCFVPTLDWLNVFEDGMI